MKALEELTVLDVLNVLSFFIGLMNLDENLTQGDKQDLMSATDKQTTIILKEIHTHLEQQDKRLDELINRLEVVENDRK
jgi:division protein CdvB (Snf7/Vps24/ESCRT-III family)